MFLDARRRAGLSREEAADTMFIGNRTLYNYEQCRTIVPPDTALKMQEIYHDPTLTARYCSEYCPIGQIYAHQVPEQQHLCSAVLGLLKEETDVEQIRGTLIELTADGVITPDEMPTFEKVMDELLDLENKIEEFKMQAAKILDMANLMQKRKSTALAAVR